MLAEVCPDLLVFFGLALPPLYGLIVYATTLGEFNHSVADYIYIAKFEISIWMCHEVNLDLLIGAENHIYWLFAIHWVVEAKESMVYIL